MTSSERNAQTLQSSERSGGDPGGYSDNLVREVPETVGQAPGDSTQPLGSPSVCLQGARVGPEKQRPGKAILKPEAGHHLATLTATTVSSTLRKLHRLPAALLETSDSI